MMGHKVCFYGELWLIIPKLSLLSPLIWSTDPPYKDNKPLNAVSHLTDLCHKTELNPSNSGRLFHCNMLEESNCHFRVDLSILSLLFYFG